MDATKLIRAHLKVVPRPLENVGSISHLHALLPELLAREEFANNLTKRSVTDKESVFTTMFWIVL